MITRRDFTKLASFAAGSMWVSSSGESQEGQPPEARNAMAVTSKARAPRSTTSAPALGQPSCLPMDWAGVIFRGGSRFRIFHAATRALPLLIADFLHRV